MKTRLSLSMLFLIFSGAGFAQINFGIQAGANLSRPSATIQTDLGSDIKASSRFGFMGGFIADMPFGDEPLRMMPELNFVAKGAKYNFSTSVLGQTVGIKGQSNIKYIELPVNLAYGFNLGSNKLIVGAGPYAAAGLSGKTSSWSYLNGQEGEKSDDKIEFGSAEDQMKRFDYGANIMAGFFIPNGLMIKLNYSHGFANLSNAADTKYRNQYLGLTLAYFIEGSR